MVAPFLKSRRSLGNNPIVDDRVGQALTRGAWPEGDGFDGARCCNLDCNLRPSRL
jgi:hypothetical protein